MIKVDPAYSSQTCAACNAVDERSRRAQRFCCVVCAHVDDADVNAAKVIVKRAVDLLAKEDNRPGRGRQTQTPTLVGVV